MKTRVRELLEDYNFFQAHQWSVVEPNPYMRQVNFACAAVTMREIFRENRKRLEAIREN